MDAQDPRAALPKPEHTPKETEFTAKASGAEEDSPVVLNILTSAVRRSVLSERQSVACYWGLVQIACIPQGHLRPEIAVRHCRIS